MPTRYVPKMLPELESLTTLLEAELTTYAFPAESRATAYGLFPTFMIVFTVPPALLSKVTDPSPEFATQTYNNINSIGDLVEFKMPESSVLEQLINISSASDGKAHRK